MELRELIELVECVDRSSLTAFEFEKGGLKVCMKKERAALPPAHSHPEAEAARGEEPVPESAVASVPPVSADSLLDVVTSPMVGVFYEAPQPGSPPFVKIGDSIQKGQVLCIIEAMKLMNEVTAETSGTIVEVLVQNEQMVEYGQPLFKVKR